MSDFSGRPAIKWTGSKRSVADRIASILSPSEGYFEPFLGGGAVLGQVSPDEGVASDIIPSLIGFWEMLRDDPDKLLEEYREDWKKLQEMGHEYYYTVRKRFNSDRDPSDLLFLSRTCVNGLIRFNQDGDFNNSFHHTRPGIDPGRLLTIFHEWSDRIQGIEFRCCDYREISGDIQEGDTVYLDPPYENTKGRYMGSIDVEPLFAFIEDLKSKGARVALSFDGSRGDHTYNSTVPDALFETRIGLDTGLSPFKKVQEKKSEVVEESLYLTWEENVPEQPSLRSFTT